MCLCSCALPPIAAATGSRPSLWLHLFFLFFTNSMQGTFWHARLRGCHRGAYSGISRPFAVKSEIHLGAPPNGVVVARTARGRAVWSNHAEHGGMTCDNDIPCALGDSSSHEERGRPVKAALRSRESKKSRRSSWQACDVHPASRGTPQDHTHPAPSPPGGKTGPGARALGHLAPH